MTEKTITITYFDYTVLLGYAVHGGRGGDEIDAEIRQSVSGIVDRVRQLNEKTPVVMSAPTTCGMKKSLGGKTLHCTLSFGHDPIPRPLSTHLWDHHDAVNDVWWNE